MRFWPPSANPCCRSPRIQQTVRASVHPSRLRGQRPFVNQHLMSHLERVQACGDAALEVCGNEEILDLFHAHSVGEACRCHDGNQASEASLKSYLSPA